MVDLDSDPTKLIEIVGIGKQLLITRGALTTFSIADDVAKYLALIPALFAAVYPGLDKLNIMRPASPRAGDAEPFLAQGALPPVHSVMFVSQAECFEWAGGGAEVRSDVRELRPRAFHPDLVLPLHSGVHAPSSEGGTPGSQRPGAPLNPSHRDIDVPGERKRSPRGSARCGSASPAAGIARARSF